MPRQMTKTTAAKQDVADTEEVTVQKKKYRDGDYILCHSIIAGGLNVNCRSGNVYEFKNYGATCEIEYRDLTELIRKHSDHIFKPRFIIDDEDFLEDFPQVKKVYTEMFTVGDLKEILLLPDNQIEKEINKLPSELKTTLKSLAATMISSGEIDSIRKVRVLTKTLDADFNFLSELFAKK